MRYKIRLPRLPWWRISQRRFPSGRDKVKCTVIFRVGNPAQTALAEVLLLSHGQKTLEEKALRSSRIRTGRPQHEHVPHPRKTPLTKEKDACCPG